MEDIEILELFRNRDENAISVTSEKYSGKLTRLAERILASESDAEECVNDTYLRAWNSIPPARPQNFLAYLSSIVRNISIDRYKAATADKRGGGEFGLSLDELEDCVSGSDDEYDEGEVSRAINEFLKKENRQSRMIFVRRYYYCDSVSELAEKFGMGENTVKSVLFRTRKRLKKHLESEGITV